MDLLQDVVAVSVPTKKKQNSRRGVAAATVEDTGGSGSSSSSGGRTSQSGLAAAERRAGGEEEEEDVVSLRLVGLGMQLHSKSYGARFSFSMQDLDLEVRVSSRTQCCMFV